MFMFTEGNVKQSGVKTILKSNEELSDKTMPVSFQTDGLLTMKAIGDSDNTIVV